MQKVCIELMNDKKIFVDLYEEYAPLSVANFLHLVDINFYAGTVFHRVINNFMAQAGGYKIENNSLVEVSPGYTIPGEFENNNFKNAILHKIGAISMARTNAPNSAASQFFICSADCDFLDKNYAAFGTVADDESLQVILDLCNQPTVCISQGFENFPKIDFSEFTIKTIYRLVE